MANIKLNWKLNEKLSAFFSFENSFSLNEYTLSIMLLANTKILRYFKEYYGKSPCKLSENTRK